LVIAAKTVRNLEHKSIRTRVVSKGRRFSAIFCGFKLHFPRSGKEHEKPHKAARVFEPLLTTTPEESVCHDSSFCAPLTARKMPYNIK
jgi:hypothetical protein